MAAADGSEGLASDGSIVIVTDDPDECVLEIEPYLALGFSHLVFHFPGKDQERAMDHYAARVLPLLRRRS